MSLVAEIARLVVIAILFPAAMAALFLSSPRRFA